jgi:hypothetical protein
MTHDKDYDIGRAIICAVLMKLFAADRTSIYHFEIAIKHMAFAT